MNGIDDQGLKIQEVYNGNPVESIMPASAFKTLKAFDPSLVLLFNQADKKWTILQEKDDKSGYSVILKLEDRDENPKAWGDWVLNKLFVMRETSYETRHHGADWRIQQMKDTLSAEKEFKETKVKQDNIDRVKDDFLTYKKGILELQGLPVSDATAGYPKIDYKALKEANEL